MSKLDAARAALDGKVGSQPTDHAPSALPTQNANEEVVAGPLSSPGAAPGNRFQRGQIVSRAGFFQPSPRGSETTTRQAEILSPAVIAAPTDYRGVAIGRDMLSRALVAHDPITAYQMKRLESPAVVVIGNVGVGKSSILKTCYVTRPLILRNRRCVVIDKKANGTEGEYADLTRRFGGEPIRISTDDNGKGLNPLDPAITSAGGAADKLAGVRVLQALAEISSGREIDEWEEGALRTAYASVMAASDKRKGEPTLPDILKALVDEKLTSTTGGKAPHIRDRFVTAGTSVALMLERLVEAFPRIFGEPTDKSVNLGSRLTTFDISQLPEQGPAADAVVGLVNAWLLGRVIREPGYQTNVVIEEGWHVMRGPNAKVIGARTKLARAHGISMVTAIHNPADIPADSPGMALVKEAETVHIFRQRGAEDRETVGRMFGLQPGSVELLKDLPAGQHLLKIGGRPEIRVEHIRSAAEREFTDTDSALTGRGA